MNICTEHSDNTYIRYYYYYYYYYYYEEIARIWIFDGQKKLTSGIYIDFKYHILCISFCIEYTHFNPEIRVNYVLAVGAVCGNPIYSVTALYDKWTPRLIIYSARLRMRVLNVL